MLLTPFGVGNHTIRFGGTFGGPLSGSIDTTYNINVVPEPAGLVLLAIGALCSLSSGRRRVRAMP